MFGPDSYGIVPYVEFLGGGKVSREKTDDSTFRVNILSEINIFNVLEFITH